MTISDAQYTAWLKDQNAVRCVLVEVTVGLAGGGTATRYLSNKTYVTGASDVPAHTPYSARITGGIKFTKSLSLDGQASLSFGDIELINTDGSMDSWLGDFWVNRPITFYLGDPSWPRADFRVAFSGVTTGIDTRKRDRINIKLSDMLQRLNNPVTEVKVGGTGAQAESLLPLCFGECHNITPVLVDATVNEYQVHQGAIEGVIEVRDNGVPVAFSQTPATGKFRLSANPAGTVTCSVQGALIPSSQRLLTAMDLSAAPWVQTNLTSISVTTSAGAPYLGSSVYAMVPNATSGQHFVRSDVTVTPGATTVHQVFVKAGAATKFEVFVQGLESSATATGVLQFSNGDFTVSVDSAMTTAGGTITAAYATKLSGGWWAITMICAPDSTSPTRRFRAKTYSSAGVANFAGDASTVYAYLASPFAAVGTWPVLPGPNNEALTGPVYRNNVVDIIRYITETYGNATQRFTDLDFDRDVMVQYGLQNMQPVGFYLSDRQNVLDVCNKLLSSSGGRLYVTTAGKVGAVELNLPQASAGTAVKSTDMVDRSLEIKQLAPVVASVKIGYCKNWTVQTGLTTGIVPEHVSLYAEEWLTQTATDSAAVTNYNLYTDPTMIETYLLTAADALAEAQRRLGMFSTQRKIIKYTGFYHLLYETLGAPQTLTHSRFGLSGGVTGQIVSISVDLLSPHVDFEVLV